jgi:hypothetical protein
LVKPGCSVVGFLSFWNSAGMIVGVGLVWGWCGVDAVGWSCCKADVREVYGW